MFVTKIRLHPFLLPVNKFQKFRLSNISDYPQLLKFWNKINIIFSGALKQISVNTESLLLIVIRRICQRIPENSVLKRVPTMNQYMTNIYL